MRCRHSERPFRVHRAKPQPKPLAYVRKSTVGDIRAGGGMVEVKPERRRSGIMNAQHVNVREGSPSFGPIKPNPVPKKERVE